MLKKIMLVLISCSLFACSSEYNTQNQALNVAYLQLEGNFENVTMIIDTQKIIIKKPKVFIENGNRVTRFPIDEGRHQITILRDGKEILKQYFYTANNDTIRILLP